jgi:hypothetical protein
VIASPAERETTENPLKWAGIKHSSIKIRNSNFVLFKLLTGLIEIIRVLHQKLRAYIKLIIEGAAA